MPLLTPPQRLLNVQSRCWIFFAPCPMMSAGTSALRRKSMRKASAVFRMLAPLIAVGVLAAGCGTSQPSPAATSRSAAPAAAATAAAEKPRNVTPESPLRTCPQAPLQEPSEQPERNRPGRRPPHGCPHWRLPVPAQGLVATTRHRCPRLQAVRGRDGRHRLRGRQRQDR